MCCVYAHYTDESTEAWRDGITDPRTLACHWWNWDLNPSYLQNLCPTDNKNVLLRTSVMVITLFYPEMQCILVLKSTDTGSGIQIQPLLLPSPVPQFLHLKNGITTVFPFFTGLTEVTPCKHTEKCLCRASLVVQWLRIHLAMKGTWIWSWVWEYPTCHGDVRYSYCACTVEPRVVTSETQVPYCPCSTAREATAVRSPHTATRM